jgi:hypothetical protein
MCQATGDSVSGSSRNWLRLVSRCFLDGELFSIATHSLPLLRCRVATLGFSVSEDAVMGARRAIEIGASAAGAANQFAWKWLCHRNSRVQYNASSHRHPIELICPSGVVSIFLSSPFCKNISVFVPPKSHLQLLPSRPTKRGVSRSSRTLGAGCDGRGSVLRATGLQGGFLNP